MPINQPTTLGSSFTVPIITVRAVLIRPPASRCTRSRPFLQLSRGPTLFSLPNCRDFYLLLRDYPIRNGCYYIDFNMILFTESHPFLWCSMPVILSCLGNLPYSAQEGRKKNHGSDVPHISAVGSVLALAEIIRNAV